MTEPERSPWDLLYEEYSGMPLVPLPSDRGDRPRAHTRGWRRIGEIVAQLIDKLAKNMRCA